MTRLILFLGAWLAVRASRGSLIRVASPSTGWCSPGLGVSSRRLRSRTYATLGDDAARELVLGLGMAVDPIAPALGVDDETLQGIHSAPLPQTLTPEQQIAFLREGHTVTRGLFSSEEIDAVRPAVRSAFDRQEFDAWYHSARVMLGDENLIDDFGFPLLETVEDCIEALEDHDVELPFLQVFNSWHTEPAVKAIATSKRLGDTAAALLGVPRVRLYQDSLFCKRPGDAETRWHSDLHMAPFDTNEFCTVWIPLHPVPSEDDLGTALHFASGSHRDFALPFWHRPQETGTDFSDRYEGRVVSHGSLEVGDATWHHGWTLHMAPPNFSETTRLALAVSFIGDGARLLPDDASMRVENEDRSSYEDWIGDLSPGDVADHSCLPLL